MVTTVILYTILCIKLGGIYGYDCASLYHFLTECICYIVKFSGYAKNIYLTI